MATKNSRKAKSGAETAKEPVEGDAKQTSKKRRVSVKHEPAVKKLSALAAAATVLDEAGQAMNCKEMIEAMAAKGYWSSPGGQTPQATLYSGIIKEIKTKGKDARFEKTERGKFARSKGGA